jgi:hypothetical protein
VVIANLGRTTTGRFGTIDQRVLRAHLDAASALYDAALFARCAEMGVPVVQPPEMIAALSTRQAEARQLWFQQRRRLTAHDGDDVVKDTPSRRDLLAKWHRQLHAVGLTVSDVLAHVPTRPRQQLRLDEDHFRRRLLGDDRKVTRRKVVEAWAWASGGAPARKVDAAVDLVIGRESLPFERELREVDAIASDRSRRMLGDRPLDPSRLERWLPAARLLDRSTSLAYRDWTRDRDRSSRSDRQGWSR